MKSLLKVAGALNLFVFLLQLKLSSSQLASDQVSAMTTIYDIFQNNTTPPVWSNVGRESSPCSWEGVDCSPDNSSVVNISLSLFSISTYEFLPLLCNLSTLQSLDVSNNHLSSLIPNSFAACGRLPFLKSLNFSRNKLSGPLPSFDGFIALETLDFSYNSLSGQIPTNLGQSNLLRELHLCCNNFTGGIPPQIITSYPNLTLIDLSVNKLSGPIPDEIGSLPKLQILLLSVNNLTGMIPSSLSNLTTLTRFAANQNAFNGTIPPGITSYLTSLDLSFNNLVGTIPPDFLSRPNLMSVDLSYNQLVGPIPPAVAGVLVSLFRLRLGSNRLNGSIPESFARLVNLTYLELDNNNLTGPIPLGLGTCRMMALLNLAQNGLSGPLPLIFGNLTNLQVLNLQKNSFVGQIPTQIISLTRLQKLNMSSNFLNGSIPLSISSLTNLTNLDLQGNSLSGTIPDSIGSLSKLLELQLGKNQLSGQIPAMPPNLQIALNLSHNHFSGPIPSTLSRLTAIEVLDLSNNRFSGQIPNSLTGLTTLTLLDLSYNNLSGVRPEFGKYVNVITTGNNVAIPTPNPPSSPQRKRKPVTSEIIIAVSCAVAAAGLLTLISMLISKKYNRINDEDLPPLGEEGLAPQGNLLTPNIIHRSHIDFGHAMEAITDSTNLKWKTRFSTYYRVVMPTGGRYFVKKLNWSDKILQLGNKERFGRELQVLGKLCNSNVMIPLAYVLTMDSAYLFYDFAPEGTLFDVLHSRVGSELDWASRYSISIGVSQGLAFLHDCNAGPILLLDLSSKSIMLKSFNEPQIGDIELCRVIDPSKSIGSLSTVAGSVGYVPPEYAYTMRVTAAGNVYSFGVVLLELVTGKAAVSGGTELAKWVVGKQSKWDEILDMRCVSKSSDAVTRQMVAVLKVALACVSVSPDTRPKMKSVLRMLLNAR